MDKSDSAYKTIGEVAKILNTSVASVSMAYNAFIEDLETQSQQKDWALPQEAEAALKEAIAESKAVFAKS